jgi:hypothetical protein
LGSYENVFEERSVCSVKEWCHHEIMSVENSPHDIWRNTVSTIKLSTDDCITHWTILNNNDVEDLWLDLNGPGERGFENEMTIKLKVKPDRQNHMLNFY